ncbi:MAG: ATP-binding cassette domain-containing protein [Clostridia bacterium]|nr:ATP-binding cassette domain-containing protein [Clostridia bacterium]
MITVKNLNYKYKTGNFSLDNINLEINDGEFVCIIGENGCGKSTFSKILAGLTKFKNGDIIVNRNFFKR